MDNAKALKVADEEAMHHEAMKDRIFVSARDFRIDVRSRLRRCSSMCLFGFAYTAMNTEVNRGPKPRPTVAADL